MRDLDLPEMTPEDPVGWAELMSSAPKLKSEMDFYATEGDFPQNMTKVLGWDAKSVMDRYPVSVTEAYAHLARLAANPKRERVSFAARIVEFLSGYDFRFRAEYAGRHVVAEPLGGGRVSLSCHDGAFAEPLGFERSGVATWKKTVRLSECANLTVDASPSPNGPRPYGETARASDLDPETFEAVWKAYGAPRGTARVAHIGREGDARNSGAPKNGGKA